MKRGLDSTLSEEKDDGVFTVNEEQEIKSVIVTTYEAFKGKGASCSRHKLFYLLKHPEVCASCVLCSDLLPQAQAKGNMMRNNNCWPVKSPLNICFPFHSKVTSMTSWWEIM